MTTRRWKWDQWKELGWKVEGHLESPLTTHTMLQVSNMTIGPLHESGLVPNTVTTLGLLTGVLAIFCVYHKRPRLGALLYMLTYLLDCIDGPLARSTDNVTNFGSQYDHVRDIVIFLGLFAVTQKRYPMDRNMLLLFAAFLAGLAVHMGLVEKHLHACSNAGEGYNILGMFGKVADFAVPSSGEQPDCERMEHVMKKYTRFCTDVNLVMFMVVYLVVQ